MELLFFWVVRWAPITNHQDYNFNEKTRPAKPTNFEPQPPKTVGAVQAFLIFHQKKSGRFGELSCGVGLPGALFGGARAPGTSNFTENYPLWCHQTIEYYGHVTNIIVCEWVMLPNTHDCWVWKYQVNPIYNGTNPVTN